MHELLFQLLHAVSPVAVPVGFKLYLAGVEHRLNQTSHRVAEQAPRSFRILFPINEGNATRLNTLALTTSF